MFTWAAEKELVEAAVPLALKSLTGLKKGRTKARETVLTSKGILLADTSDGEWLTGKSGQQHIMFWDFINRDLRDVTGKPMIVTIMKVGTVGLLCHFIPLTGENATPPDGLKSASQSADPGKQVNESKVSPDLHVWSNLFTGDLLQQLDHGRLWLSGSTLVASERVFRTPGATFKFSKRQSRALF